MISASCPSRQYNEQPQLSQHVLPKVLDPKTPLSATVNVAGFAGLNTHGFSPMNFFAEILSRCLGQQCSLFTYN